MSDHKHAHTIAEQREALGVPASAGENIPFVARPQQPSVGHVVHYVSHGSPVLADGSQKYRPECRAAIVTAVSHDGDSEQTGADVSLAVLNPTGMFFQENLRHSDEHVGGSWHWPERV